MEDWQDSPVPKLRDEDGKEKERTGGVSALPATLANATEAAVLESLHGLLTDKRITASQARSLYAAWKVAQSSGAEEYASFEVVRHWTAPTHDSERTI